LVATTQYSAQKSAAMLLAYRPTTSDGVAPKASYLSSAASASAISGAFQRFKPKHELTLRKLLVVGFLLVFARTLPSDALPTI